MIEKITRDEQIARATRRFENACKTAEMIRRDLSEALKRRDRMADELNEALGLEDE